MKSCTYLLVLRVMTHESSLQCKQPNDPVILCATVSTYRFPGCLEALYVVEAGEQDGWVGQERFLADVTCHSWAGPDSL